MKALILLFVLFSFPTHAKVTCLDTLFDFFTVKPPQVRTDCLYSPGRPLKIEMVYKGGFMFKIGSKPLYVETAAKVNEGDVIDEGAFEYIKTESHSHFGEYHTFKMK